MFLHRKSYLIIICFICLCTLFCCKSKHAASEKQIVTVPEKMDEKVTENVKDVLQYSLENYGKINDSIKLSLPAIVDSFYHKNNYVNIWSKNENWEPLADSLFTQYKRL